MPRDCRTHGHILVDDDPTAECLACGTQLTPWHRISIHVARPHDELDHHDSTAHIDGPDGWGHAHLGGDTA